MAKRKHKPLTDQIRNVLADSGETRYHIAKQTGLSEPQLCRFAGGAGLSMTALDTLAEYLSLEIVVRTKRKGK